MGIISKIKWHIKDRLKTRSLLDIQVKVYNEWFGNAYGGFYVAKDLTPTQPVIYSFGIGEDISFDLEVIGKFHANVYGFDPTPKSIIWVQQNISESNFNFFPFGIGTISEKTHFFLPKNPDYVSGSIVEQDGVNALNRIEVELKCINDIAKMFNHSAIDILKMDIEGAEYDVIENLLESDIKIDQILVEIHDRFFQEGIKKSNRLLKKLNKAGYYLFAMSDSKEELSFIHSSKLS